MKRFITLSLFLSLFSAARLYGQTCGDGSYFIAQYNTPPNPTYCIGQPVSLLISGFCSSATITWQVSNTEEGPYTILGTSVGSDMTCSAAYTFTPSEAGTYWVKASRENIPCSWPAKQLTVVNTPPPPAPVVTAATECPNVVLSIQDPDPSLSTQWYSSSFGSQSSISGATNTTLTRNPASEKGSFGAAYINSAGCRGPYSNWTNVTTNGIAPFYSTENSGDIYFTYDSGNGFLDYLDACGKYMLGVEASGPSWRLRLKASVSFHAGIKSFEGRPVVQKHFDINPAPDQTYTVTPASYALRLYFTQAEFDAFNALLTPESPKLPREPNGTLGYFNDQGYFVPEGGIYYGHSGQCNLRVIKASGEPTIAGGGSESYPGGAAEIAGTTYSNGNNNIITLWDDTKGVWAVYIKYQTSFSGFFITTNGATALPVSLAEFTAQKQENTVQLRWHTTEEAGSDHFEILHSADGKRWNTAGSVTSAGESSFTKHYNFTHTTPLEGLNYYRLKMIDLDGSYAYSKIVSETMPYSQSLSVSPNPAQGFVRVRSVGNISNYSLLTTTGREISSGSGVNTNDLEIPLGTFGPGIYLLQIRYTGGGDAVRKIIVK